MQQLAQQRGDALFELAGLQRRSLWRDGTRDGVHNGAGQAAPECGLPAKGERVHACDSYDDATTAQRAEAAEAALESEAAGGGVLSKELHPPWVRERLAPLIAWLQPASSGAAAAELERQLAPMPTEPLTAPPTCHGEGGEREVDPEVEAAEACLRSSLSCYWWALLISARHAVWSAEGSGGDGGDGAGGTGRPAAAAQSWRGACLVEAVASRCHTMRRLGCLLNELGQRCLRKRQPSAADSCFVDGVLVFTRAGDAANTALLLLNRGAIARRRAAWLAAAHASATAAIQAAERALAQHDANGPQAAGVAPGGAPPGGAPPPVATAPDIPDNAELHWLLTAVEYQREARHQLRQLKGGGPPSLRAMVLRELSAGEAAAGSALHTVVAETGGSEVILRRAGECLASAQQLYDELGELAQVQLMMRKQGSLYLANLVCAVLDETISARAASSRLTLALRHYERCLKPELLAQGAASPSMERCATEARLELANFFLTWSDSAASSAVAAEAAGWRTRHLETALSHARAARHMRLAVASQAVATNPGATVATTPTTEPQQEAAKRQVEANLPQEVVDGLLHAEQTALRELIKAHTAHGNASRANTLKEAYRRLLSELRSPG